MSQAAKWASLFQDGAIAVGLTPDKYINAVVDFEARTAAERSDPDTRNAAKSLIVEMFQADPNADLDPGDIAVRAGLKNCQADRSFVRHQLKQARLTYRPAAMAAE